MNFDPIKIRGIMMMKKRSSFLTYFFLCCFYYVGFLLFYLISEENLFMILTSFLTADGDISSKTSGLYKCLLTPLAFFVIFLVPKFMKRKLDVNYYFIYILFISIHFLIYIHFSRIEKPIEGSFLESSTVLISLVAVAIFIFTGFRGHSASFILAVFWFIFSMEEISWGQKVFDFEIPKFFVQYNDQSELNFHNFFNSYFGSIYVIFNFLIFCSLTFFSELKIFQRLYRLISINFVIKVSDRFSIWIIPLMLIGATIVPGHEFVEQQWSLLGFILASLLAVQQNHSAKLRQT